MKLDFRKMDGVVLAVVQDARTLMVLMVGVMNKEAFDQTIKTGKVTFWSRARRELWTKGETSGNYLKLEQILVDCDKDTVICMVKPAGPTCHTGAASCFQNIDGSERQFTKEGK